MWGWGKISIGHLALVLLWLLPVDLNPHFTYEKFSPFADTFKKRVSKNTFFVLVRVVDELW